MGIKYGVEFSKVFEWKFPAQRFVKTLKRKAKRGRVRIKVELLPHIKFISSREYHEKRVVGYTVRWYYLPLKKTK